MLSAGTILCDGCGQAADQEHIARRLKRLENMTRYRPLHVQALFLGAVSPTEDGEHLYCPAGEFRGEGAVLLQALGVESSGRGVEATLVDFQRRGYFLAHLMECPANFADRETRTRALQDRFAAAAIRIRRSLKPKKVVALGRELDELVAKLVNENLGAELILAESGQPFRLEELGPGSLVTAVTAAITPSL